MSKNLEEKFSETQISNHLIEIIKEKYFVQEDADHNPIFNELTTLSSFMDSLDIVEFIMDIEKYYDIHIPDDQIKSMPTIKDMVDLIYEKIN